MRRTLLRLGLAAALAVPASFVIPAHAANGCTATNPTAPMTPVTNATATSCTYPATGLGRYEAVVDGPWVITKTYRVSCVVNGHPTTCPKTDTIASGLGPNQGLLSTKAGDSVNVVIDPGTLGFITASDS